MMRRQTCSHLIATAFTLVLTTMVSPNCSAQSDNQEEIVRYVSVAHSVTPEGRAHVVVTKTKPRLHLAKQQRPVVQLVLEDDDTDYYDELPDIQVGYRRPELIDQTADVDLSDEVKLRLAIARMKALQAYNAKWA